MRVNPFQSACDALGFVRIIDILRPHLPSPTDPNEGGRAFRAEDKRAIDIVKGVLILGLVLASVGLELLLYGPEKFPRQERFPGLLSQPV
jgi:hypothetical protein